MTLLALTDIEPGLVAWMDTATLLRDARTRTSYTGKPFRTGPFLCVGVGPNATCWLTLTRRTNRHGSRFLIRPEWRAGGPTGWRDRDEYCNDLRQPYIGRDVVFLAASHVADCHRPAAGWPRVTTEGLTAIRARMEYFHSWPWPY